MSAFSSPSLIAHRGRSMAAALAAVLVLLSPASFAGPGAHGPGGEHLDPPAGTQVVSSRPRVEAQTDLFELVATLSTNELLILVDRYETNEPVLGATLEVESGGQKAKANFKADQGHYTVEDPAFLKLLATRGEHALVFTLTAGNDADLLNGALVTAAGNSHAPSGGDGLLRAIKGNPVGLAIIVAALGTLAALFWLRKRRPGVAGLIMLHLALFPAFLLLAATAHAGPGAHGPGGEHLDAPATASNASGLARLPDGSVNVPKASQRRMGIRTLLVPESEAAASVELSGRVVADPNAGGRVQALHGGRIEPGPNGLPIVGQPVKSGEVLAWVRHHAEPYALGNQKSLLAELRSQREVSELRVQRLESLEGTVPRKEIEAARAEARSLREREKNIDLSLTSREALVAPVSGVIARADVLTGQVVEARDLLFEVVDPTRVLVEATTADPGLPSRIAAAQLQGLPEAKLKLLGAARSLRDGVLPLTFAVRADPPGKPLPLAIGQPVTLVVAQTERTKGIVLPAQAVVRNPANEPIVWIKSGAERYIPQPVNVRALDARTVIVTGGLAPDNRVVVQGAPLIAQIR